MSEHDHTSHALPDESKADFIEILGGMTLSMEEAISVVHLSNQHPRHCAAVMTLLEKLDDQAQRTEILATSFIAAPDAWLSKTERRRLNGERPDWASGFMLANEKGYRIWERFLASFYRTMPSHRPHQLLLAWIARHVEPFMAPLMGNHHSAHPALTNSQVWAWLWAFVPLTPCRRGHWSRMTRHMDLNFSILESGQFKIPSLLMRAINTTETASHCHFSLQIGMIGLWHPGDSDFTDNLKQLTPFIGRAPNHAYEGDEDLNDNLEYIEYVETDELEEEDEHA